MSADHSVFARTNTEIVVPIPTGGMNICVRLSCLCVVLFVGSGLATDWSPIEGVLKRAIRSKKMAVEPKETMCRQLKYSTAALRIAMTTRTLYPHKLALASTKSGVCSVGIVRSRTEATEFSILVLAWRSSESRLFLHHYFLFISSCFSGYARMSARGLSALMTIWVWVKIEMKNQLFIAASD
jgi:hypothetical protein